MMDILALALSILGGALIGSSVHPFFAAALEPRDEFSAAPTLIRFGIGMVLIGAVLWGLAFLIVAVRA